MSRKRSDEIASEAARRLARGQAEDMRDALQQAARTRGIERSAATPKQVRRHAEAMSMQSLGEAEYRRRRQRWLCLAEEIMSALELAIADSSTLLVGRAADGHFDGDPSIHVRIHTQVAIGDIARVIHELGDDDAEQAEIAFTTLDGRAGRLSQVQWVEEGVRIVLTRCPQRAEFQSRSDLSSGAKITTLTAAQLRTKLAEQA